MGEASRREKKASSIIHNPSANYKTYEPLPVPKNPITDLETSTAGILSSSSFLSAVFLVEGGAGALFGSAKMEKDIIATNQPV